MYSKFYTSHPESRMSKLYHNIQGKFSSQPIFRVAPPEGAEKMGGRGIFFKLIESLPQTIFLYLSNVMS